MSRRLSNEDPTDVVRNAKKILPTLAVMQGRAKAIPGEWRRRMVRHHAG